MIDYKEKYERLLAAVTALGKRFSLTPIELDLESLESVNLAFSSSGEDLWLRQFMKSRLRSGTPGFYIDVGANEPMITSNSYLFYCSGWRGVCIDANPRFFPEYKVHRPRDILVNAAVSDLGTTLYFAEEKMTAGHKTARVMSNPNDFGPSFYPPVKVPAMTLAQILQAHVPPGTDIDFMSMDLEDSELPALRSNDWSTYRPRVILIECGAGFDPLAPLRFPTIDFLHSHGYRYQGSCNNNVLMTSPEF
jgi:FkbM family methyltransferase